MSNYSLILATHFSGKSWSLKGDTYEGLEWSDTTTKPTQNELDALWEPLKESINANAYKESRVKEYPLITDYLDGVVKGDQVQIDAYIAACLAVKDKYPKL